jgi:hypothetical protein
MTASLDALLLLLYALEWLQLHTNENRVILKSFFTGVYGDPVQIAIGERDPITKTYQSRATEAEAKRLREMLGQVRELVREERFLNWQVAFPGVWSDWESDTLSGGFDAIIGNPPWDRMKLQQVEWFAVRRQEIALAQRADDRKRMIALLEKARDPLAAAYAKTEARADTGIRMARSSGDYPFLSGGNVNLYSLFVERAVHLVKPNGIVGLLTPSGIASDKTAAPFFKSLSTGGHLKALYDFENRATRSNAPAFFPDVDSRFKFCVSVASPSRIFEATRAVFLQDVSEINNPERCFALSPTDFSRVNPNTGTAPIFRTHRDAILTTAIYRRLPILVNHANSAEGRIWPLRYFTMFHMTNDSKLFRTRQELEDKEKAYPVGGNRFRSTAGDWVPLYEGKMAQAFDHRAASVIVNLANQHRPAQPRPATPQQHADPNWLPSPQYWVPLSACGWDPDAGWVLGFKEITSPTNERTFISALFPAVGFGNKLPIFKPENAYREEYLLCANFNSIVFDFVTRQKIQGQTLNLFIVEQLPVVPLSLYASTHFGAKAAREIVSEAVLELTYTASDMASFARDMAYIDESGNTKNPFVWNEEKRLNLRAKLDAVYFHLYGITDRSDVRYIYSNFPILEREERVEHSRYLSCDLCLAWMNALAAGNPDAEITL